MEFGALPTPSSFYSSKQTYQNNHPYSSSTPSSASSSSSSIFSVDGFSSQSSVTSSSSSVASSLNVVPEVEHTECFREQPTAPKDLGLEGISFPTSRTALNALGNGDCRVASELRQHPRRTYPEVQNDIPSGCPKAGCARVPPPLIRQSDRKVNFVDGLVDSAAQIVEAIWPLSVMTCRSDAALGGKGVLPLRTFIQETLRRSRTSYSTLQVALYYLILIKSHVPKYDFTMEQPEDEQSLRALQCGRRMFLSALILASKYLQDRNYSARAWSKISGLNAQEINANEMTFLSAVNWRLHISEAVFQRWTDVVLKCTSSTRPPAPTAATACPGRKCDWRTVIPILTPDLDNVSFDSAMSTDADLRSSMSGAESSTPRLSYRPDCASKPGSNDQTPTPSNCIPRVLEPQPQPQILPGLSRAGPLPTPQMTPSGGFSTPAAGAGSFCSRRSSMGAAMVQAQNTCLTRITCDQWNPPPYAKPTALDSYQSSGRRSSLARSSSLASSPDSMVSDSSRSSRSSSISSTSSSICAPNPANLAMQATRRNAKLLTSTMKENAAPVNGPLIEGVAYSNAGALSSSPESYALSAGSIPDFSNFSLNTPRETMARPASREPPCGLKELLNYHSMSPQTYTSLSCQAGRKRSRCSDEANMQQQVRQLMALKARNENNNLTSVSADPCAAQSFLLQEPVDVDALNRSCNAKALQSPSHMSPHRLPLLKHMGRKRACCGEEAARVLAMRDRRPGPGMWEGVL
ncbi:MAG: hypothetical protein M1819_004175 [Sarea resinae]|nr:MAG: hypothetical protein M1819_004175 [Sarea resinae]